MTIHTSIQTIGSGAIVDVYAQTLGSGIPLSQTLPHRVILQNRSGQPLLVGDPLGLGASPVTGLGLDDGEDFEARLRSPDRINVKNASGSSVAGLNVMIVTE
jgi:hypothetical protein